jgi:hypothetical protein
MGWVNPIKKRLNPCFQACYLGFECNPLLVQTFKSRVALKKPLRQTCYELGHRHPKSLRLRVQSLHGLPFQPQGEGAKAQGSLLLAPLAHLLYFAHSRLMVTVTAFTLFIDPLNGPYPISGAHIALGYSSEVTLNEYPIGRSPQVTSQVPQSEAIARELVPLLSNQQALDEAWNEAVEQASGVNAVHGGGYSLFTSFVTVDPCHCPVPEGVGILWAFQCFAISAQLSPWAYRFLAWRARTGIRSGGSLAGA